MLEPRYARFLDILRRVYANISFLEALKKAPMYLKFLRELMSKKGDTRDASVDPIGEASRPSYSAGHQNSCRILVASPIHAASWICRLRGLFAIWGPV